MQDPLHMAAGGNRQCVIRIFLKHGAPIGALDFITGPSSLRCAVQNAEGAKTLQERGADIISLDANGDLPVILAARWGGGC